ncbi:protein artichoke-like [Ischnura elegans]|uniref:protein artichoke-like n=1 Tax=Ischnura elegans TaxID=197161 RepID=UPI001ED893E9|nr:protein artichoke-like [Ischnura elegans]
MSGATKRSICTGWRYFYIVTAVISIMGCSSEKLATDSEDGVMMGFHCEAEPRCLCLNMRSPNAIIVCEDKVFIRRRIGAGVPVYYEIECMGETEIDPYHYLQMILYANFSAPSIMYTDRVRLDVSNCSAPSRSQSVLFGALSAGSIGGWRDLPLEILTINCQQSKNVHLSKQHLSGLKELKKLILICPKLAKLDEDLLSGTSKRLENLQIIDTQVRDLPERFFADMEAIKLLYLRQNKLKSLGRSFLSSMRSLEMIDLGENEIKSLDDDVFLKTEKLSSVQLSENLLTTLPTSLCSLRKLKFLLAEYNRITFIPQECLCNMPHLSHVSLNGNKLVSLGLTPEEIAPTYKKVLSSDEKFLNSSSIQEKPANLNNAWIGTSLIKDLFLDNNLLSSLPDGVFYGMHGLQFLNISSNRITFLPQDIFSRNENLMELLASNNLFTNIPATLLRNNTRLRKLDLSHNFIETLDLDFFATSTSLCYIHINDNRIHHLPDEIFKPFEGKWMGCNEFVLDMSRNRLEDVPELSLPLLTNLSLSENNLTWIKHDMLWQAQPLKEINISHNLIHTIDDRLELGEYYVLFEKYLLNLEVVDLSSNLLTVLPSITFVAKTLKHLNVSNNYITEFAFRPEIKGRDANHLPLEAFDMSGNRLKSVEFFDHWLWHSGKTKYVDLSHNRIDLEGCSEHMHSTRFVWGCLSSLCWLPTLEVVILSHNQITYIPMEFQHYLPNLRYVDLSHNKIKRLWHGDLLFTRARDTMDLELFWTRYYGPIDPEPYLHRYPGSKNLTIDLRHNSIASLQLPDDKIEVVIPGCDIDSKFSRVKLLLGHNPFVCDCEVFKLLRYTSKEMRPTSALERLNGHRLVVPAVIDIQDLHCSKPDSVKGKAVAEVDTWAYHWLPMMGLCWNDTGVEPPSGHTATNTTEIEAAVDPPT